MSAEKIKPFPSAGEEVPKKPVLNEQGASMADLIGRLEKGTFKVQTEDLALQREIDASSPATPQSETAPGDSDALRRKNEEEWKAHFGIEAENQEAIEKATLEKSERDSEEALDHLISQYGESEAPKIAIQDAKSFDELKQSIRDTHGVQPGFLDTSGGLKNSAARFGAEGYAYAIDQVLLGKASVDTLPPEYGIREKVEKLLSEGPPPSPEVIKEAESIPVVERVSGAVLDAARVEAGNKGLIDKVKRIRTLYQSLHQKAGDVVLGSYIATTNKVRSRPRWVKVSAIAGTAGLGVLAYLYLGGTRVGNGPVSDAVRDALNQGPRPAGLPEGIPAGADGVPNYTPTQGVEGERFATTNEGVRAGIAQGSEVFDVQNEGVRAGTAPSSEIVDSAIERSQRSLEYTREALARAGRVWTEWAGKLNAAPETIADFIRGFAEQVGRASSETQQFIQAYADRIGVNPDTLRSFADSVKREVETLPTTIHDYWRAWAELPNSGLFQRTVAQGDTTWSIVQSMLANAKIEGFPKFSMEHVTHLTDAVVDRLRSLSSAELRGMGFSSGNIDLIRAGDKLNISELFENQDFLKKIIGWAQKLTAEQLQNIAENIRLGKT